MANEQYIRNRRGTLLTTVNPGRTKTISSLVLHGYGTSEYGRLRDNNLVFLLETFYADTAPVDPIEGQLWFRPGDQLYIWTETGSPASGLWDTVVPAADTLGFNIIAGDGLVGGGFPTTSPAEVVISVGKGTGINFGSPGNGSPVGAIHADASQIDHDSLSNYVADEHLDHSTISISAGAGLFIGSPFGFPTPAVGEDVRYINQTNKPISIHIGGGDGINSLANEIETDDTVFYAAGSPQIQTIAGAKHFYGINSQILGSSTATAANPAYSFSNDPTAGVFRSASDTIGFATAGVERFTIRDTGVLRSSTANYENLLSHDDDIPNKAYVDSFGGSATSPTENTFVGTSFISGLTAGKKYLVVIYGVVPNKGNVTQSLNTIYIRAGTNPFVGTVLEYANPHTINWMDGNCPTQCSFVVDTTDVGSPATTAVACEINGDGFGNVASSYMIAVELGNGAG